MSLYSPRSTPYSGFNLLICLCPLQFQREWVESEIKKTVSQKHLLPMTKDLHSCAYMYTYAIFRKMSASTTHQLFSEINFSSTRKDKVQLILFESARQQILVHITLLSLFLLSQEYFDLYNKLQSSGHSSNHLLPDLHFHIHGLCH